MAFDDPISLRQALRLGDRTVITDSNDTKSADAIKKHRISGDGAASVVDMSSPFKTAICQTLLEGGIGAASVPIEGVGLQTPRILGVCSRSTGIKHEDND